MTATDPGSQPAMVPPGPVPTAFNVGQVEAPDGRMVVALLISTPLGMTNLFLDPGVARKLGVELQRVGSASASNLLVPGPGPGARGAPVR